MPVKVFVKVFMVTPTDKDCLNFARAVAGVFQMWISC
jgi:hypothetical protein